MREGHFSNTNIKKDQREREKRKGLNVEEEKKKRHWEGVGHRKREMRSKRTMRSRDKEEKRVGAATFIYSKEKGEVTIEEAIAIMEVAKSS